MLLREDLLDSIKSCIFLSHSIILLKERRDTMANCLKESKTKENLMKAFAGESQARNRYTFAAEKAREQSLYSIADVFEFTAEQERAHAERYYELLRELSGENIEICGGFPVDQSEDIVTLLKAAKHNEFEEYEDVYQNFGDIAKEEGFMEIASTFYQIAEVEKTHGERFACVAGMLEEGTYFESARETSWMCTNCGYIHTGNRAPSICPVCRHARGYFIPLTMAPYQG